MNKICYGCGVKLQSDDEHALGYVPLKKISDAKYCMRCFRMNNYGENKTVDTPKDIKEIVNKINKDDKHVIFLVDFLNLNNEVVSIYKSIKKNKILVVNKCELLPKHIKKERIEEFIRNTYGIKEIIKLKGGTKKHGASLIYNYLKVYGITETYILGISNSGKSTLINDLIDISDSKLNKITVNKKANTTLDFIRVNLNDEVLLIDSPGFILDKSLNSDVTGKNITAYNINIKAGNTISLLDNKYFFKFDDDTTIVLYTNSVANKVIKKYYKAAPGLKYNINIDKNNLDIVIYGIGFITVKKNVNVTTNIPLEHIEVRDSMFGGLYE